MQSLQKSRPVFAVAIAAVLVCALTACSRFISHEAGSASYDTTQQSGSATFTQSHPTTDPAAYEGSRVAKVHVGASSDPSHARGVINLQPANNYGKYGAALYFPPGTLNGTDPKQQTDIDVLRWDYGSEAEFGGIRIGSDHRARLLRGQSGQPVQSIGDPFNLHEGCWNWLVVNQRLNLPHPDAPPPFSEVYLNGRKVVDSQAANGFGHSAEKVRFGAVSVAGGTTQDFDFFIDQSFISNDAMPPPTGNACDPDWGGSSQPSPIAQSVQTPMSDATSFLYTGDDPIQQGVAAGTIEEQRAAVLRGRVLARQGQPLAGVQVTVVGHTEFGRTETRPDGNYHMAVNGGGNMRLRFERDDHLPVDREVDVPWQQYAHIDDVVLTPLDANPTDIELASTTESIQVARGSPVTDSDGTREATLLFPAGTTATMTLPDNSQQPLPDASVRATEYTVGQRGPEAMPAELPPTSGYTYAVDYTVDEALDASATKVTFDPAAISYTDNFVGFPVGEDVPAGYYDRAKGAWVPSDSGRVIKIRSETGGIAELEVTDSGEAATPAELTELGITDSERVKLAQLYDAPKTLWRVKVEHFSSWDLNWGLVPPDDVIPPGQTPLPKIHGIDQDCPEIGSIIECEDQVLGETLPLTGSDLSLNYRSDRTPGHKAAYRIEIPLDVPLQGGDVHPNLDRIEVQVEIAGRRFEETFTSPTAGQTHLFVWDGKDTFGRTLQGQHEAKISIGHTYEAEYGTTSRFGYNGGGQRITGSRTPREVTLWSDRTVKLGAWNARGQGLGGWTLDAHHVYDPNSETLLLGDGTRRSAEDVTRVVNTRAGGGPDQGEDVPARNAEISGTAGVAAAPDGGYYLSEVNRNRVRRVSPEGQITTVAGDGQPGFSGDEGQASSARLRAPWGLDVGPDGSLYIADFSNHRIRRVSPDGVIRTVAGSPEQGNHGDGGLATEAALNQPTDVAVAADGSLYIASLDRVRRVDPAGRISTVFSPTPGFAGLFNIWGIDVATDGTVYFSDNRTIKRLSLDGDVAIVAGRMDLPGDAGEGGSATAQDVRIWATGDVLAQADGSFYFSDRNNNKIKYVSPDGIITTVAGTGLGAGAMDPSPDGTPARRALINHPAGLALGPEGALLVAVGTTNRILGVSSPVPGFSGEDIAIPSEDGRELYQFNGSGRHLRTLDTLTGAELYRFEYTAAGALWKVQDGDEKVTEILPNAAGEPTAIVAPFGQSTAVALDSDGFLAFVRNPMLETFDLDYRDEPDLKGLLSVVEDPKGQLANYVYDTGTGRLTEAQDRADGFKTLTRTSVPNGSETELTTRLGRATKYRVEDQSNGDMIRTHTDPAGHQSTLKVGQDGSREATSVDDTVTKTQRGPDPRFGMQASVLQDLTVETPDGRTLDLGGTRQVTPASGDPLALQTQTDTLTVNGRQYTTAYDASQDRFTTTTPQNRTATSAIDDQGRPTRAEAPELHPVTTTYLPDGRLDSEKQGPDNDPMKQRLWQYTYEPGSGFLNTVTDPLNRITTFDYDPAGRVTEQVLPGNRQVQFDYDDNGNLSSVTPPSRPQHVFDHNAVDLVKTYDPPNIGFTPTTTYGYNEDQDLERITRPDGREVTFNYELTTRRLASFDQPSGQTDLDYDPDTGNVSSIAAPGSEGIDLAYDGALPKKETYSGTVTGSASRTYDDDLRIASTSVNDAHTVDYEYDADSLLEQAESLDLHRDPESGLLTGSTLANIETTIVPNGFGEPDSISDRFGTQTLYSATFVRDNAGRITEKTETTSQGTYVYAYDYYAGTGFLKNVMRDGDPIAEYTYDANGNRLTGPGVTTPADYDDQDRLESYGNAVYAYNEGGELETKTVGSEVTQYDYDALGSLENVTLPDGSLIDYVTDGYGRRIAKKRGNTVEQRFIYGEEGLGPVAELNSDGSVRTRFVYATRSNVPDYMVRNGTTYRFVLDHLGSPRTIVDATTGEVVQEMDFDEYGKVTRDTQPGLQPFGFAGGLYDTDTGLVLFGARDYDASTGRWTAKDPIGFAGGDTNLFGYVINDPVNLSDPQGLYWGEDKVNAVKDLGMGISNTAAGALNAFTGGLSNKIAGVDGSCAGPGYGLGEVLGDLNPRGAAKRLARVGAKHFAKGAGRRTTRSEADIAARTGHSVREVKNAIHKVKRRLSKGGAVRNPDVSVDPVTGEVYPLLPDGTIAEDPVGNIFDHL